MERRIGKKLPLWTVVLAAGAGRRLSSVTGGVPKQFWRGAHGASLLGQTLTRFAPLAPPSQTVVIVDAAHQGYADVAGLAEGPATLVIQPADRGTAAGVLMALMPVLEFAPNAIVAITPSDHGVIDHDRFRGGVTEGAREARERGDIVLFGVEPEAARQDYGWISVGPVPVAKVLPRVESFVEKPGPVVAERLLRAGAVWNTMVIVARARAIRHLYEELQPELADVFRTALGLPASERAGFLAAAYTDLPRLDFSRDLLTHARSLAAYVWPVSMGWSDLGTPDRLHQWHHRRNASPSHPRRFTAA